MLAASAFTVKNLDSLNPKYGGRKASKGIWNYCALNVETEVIIQTTVTIYKLSRHHVVGNVIRVYIPEALNQLVNGFWTSHLSPDLAM